MISRTARLCSSAQRFNVRAFSSSLGVRGSELRNDIKVTQGKDDEQLEISVKPIPRINEPLETKRARLLYQSRKRGILESDLLLSRFAAKYLKGMSEEELLEYDRLLDLPDWDIYYWATNNFEITPLKDEWKDSKILKMLQEFSVNRQKEILRMPELKEYK
ncbi:succinate dehydrogenase assembly factor [Saccharomycopsis crataegensis]|uniref:Succinate dehydrogenase assembly factor 2, mitochondrial n=1 Tax=Saccharomycopsis crataegensis TaxID=43959 RepID=A0AAV5QPR6_9ASCO|nr:succinate dehydrogenase assembly factor [Saccharomycopsis crataegensis]